MKNQSRNLSPEAAEMAAAFDECPEVFARLGIRTRDKAIASIEARTRCPLAAEDIPEGYIGSWDQIAEAT